VYVTGDETAGRALFEETLARGDWDYLTETTKLSWINRAKGDLSFIPSARRDSDPDWHIRSLGAYGGDGDDASEAPTIPPPEIPARAAAEGEIPVGAKRVVNLARKAGWEVLVTFARGPWVTGKGLLLVSTDEGTGDDDEAGAGAEKVPAVVESIAVRAGRDGQRVAATWIRKPWTGPGAEGKYVFQSAHIWPTYGDGGLHDSATLMKVLRSE
jgi:hypothetical protein